MMIILHLSQANPPYLVLANVDLLNAAVMFLTEASEVCLAFIGKVIESSEKN